MSDRDREISSLLNSSSSDEGKGSDSDDADAESAAGDGSKGDAFSDREDKRHRRRMRENDNEDIRSDSEDEKDTKSNSASVTQVVSQSAAIIKTLLKFLFSTTTSCDTFILLIGSVFAIIHGITFPFVAVLFGSMTNSFIQQSISGYANETRGFYYNATEEPFNITGGEILDDSQNLGVLVPAQVGNVFDLINKVVLQTFTKHEALTKEEFLENVHLAGILFLWLAIVIFASSFCQVVCWEWVAANQQFQLRESVVERTLRQDMWWFQKHDIGELIADIFGQVGRVREALGFRFGSVVESCAMFVMSSLIAISISWRLALVFLSPIPFIIFRMLTLGRKIAQTSEKGEELWKKAESVAAEYLSNADAVTACNQQLKTIKKFGKKLEAAIDELMKKYHLAALGRGMLSLFMYGSYAVAFWYACHLLMQGKISAGEIYTIFLAITMGSVGITNIINSVTVIGTAYGAAVHLSEFGHPLPDLDCFSQKGKFHPLDGEIEFEHVSFAYPGGRKVLDDLSFKIETGKTVAILADVGEGKTTIANLILRMYHATRGKVKIDGINIRKLNLKTLRRNIGIALQHSFLSDPQIDENIRAAREFLSDDEVQVARLTADPDLTLPDDEHCEDATQLPKNDRHKINIARALAPDPPILVLDETFTHLHPNEKEAIRTSVLEYRDGMTTIILTYDILSLASADIDKIYILKDGRILPGNIGTHAELMERGGEGNIYKTMYHSATVLQDMKGEMGGTVAGTLMGRSEFGERRKPKPTPTGVIELFGLQSTFTMFGIGLLGVLLTGVQLAVFAYYFVEMFGTFSKTGDELEYDGKFWAGMIGIIAVVACVSIWLRTLYMSAAGMYTMLNIRTTAFGSIIRRPKSYYNETEPKTSPIALGTKVLHHTPLIKSVLEDHLPQGLSTAVTLMCIGGIVTALVWQIGLILVLGVYSILVLLAILQYKIQRTGENKFCEADAKTSDLVTTGMDLMELIQTHSMQAHYFNKYRDAVEVAWQEAHEQAFAFGILFGLSEAIFFVFFGVALIYGGYLINVEAIEPQKLFKIFFSMAFCVVSFNEILAIMPDFAKAMCSLEEISNLVREDDELDTTLDALNDEGDDVPDGEGKIDFCYVHFGYSVSDDRDIFKGLNLRIPGGKTTAITGPPSFGGSTLLALIQRFYDPKSGHINLDDRIIRFLKISQLRDKIAWVPEQILFFDGTLAHNIKFGKKQDVTLKDVKEVLTTVKLMDTLGKRLSVRRDSKHWKTLSRGKQVLIGIARALLRNPDILLLDSPTSAMSAAEEMKIIDVIREIRANRTCVIVSDSQLALELGDKIVVIQNGVVLEEGTLNELKENKNGYYSNRLMKSE